MIKNIKVKVKRLCKYCDIYFELDKHCIIVEIDKNQYNTYE